MIIRFHQDLANFNFKSRFEKMDEDGNIKMVRLIEGSTVVEEAKQDKNAREKAFKTGAVNVSIDGELYYQTEITDKAIINFLKETDYWGGKIKEFNPVDESKKKSEAFKKTTQLLMEVAKMDKSELLAVGYARLGKAALQYGKDNDIEGLRLEVATEVQESPEEMEAVMGDWKNNEKLLVGTAMAKGIIIETEAGNNISWGHNKSRITSVPEGVTPLDAMVDFFGEAEGREVKKQIFTKLTESAKPKTADKVPVKPADKTPAKPEGDKGTENGSEGDKGTEGDTDKK